LPQNVIMALQEFRRAKRSGDSSEELRAKINLMEALAANNWEGWKKIFELQNTTTGALIISLGELEKQRNLEAEVDALEAVSGRGYTSVRKGCLTPPIRNLPPEVYSNVSESKRCVIWREIVTPGDLLAEAAASTIQQAFNWVVSIDEINEATQIIIGFLIERVFDKLSGLAEGGDIDKTEEGERVPFRPPSCCQETECRGQIQGGGSISGGGGEGGGGEGSIGFSGTTQERCWCSILVMCDTGGY
jgi:hypothetical protein